MSIKERARKMEKKVVSGSKTVGRDVKQGLRRAGTKIKRGAGTFGSDLELEGSSVREAGGHRMTRIKGRLSRNKGIDVKVKTSN
jgi:hypothetical protein